MVSNKELYDIFLIVLVWLSLIILKQQSLNATINYNKR